MSKLFRTLVRFQPAAAPKTGHIIGKMASSVLEMPSKSDLETFDMNSSLARMDLETHYEGASEDHPFSGDSSGGGLPDSLPMEIDLTASTAATSGDEEETPEKRARTKQSQHLPHALRVSAKSPPGAAYMVGPAKAKWGRMETTHKLRSDSGFVLPLEAPPAWRVTRGTPARGIPWTGGTTKAAGGGLSLISKPAHSARGYANMSTCMAPARASPYSNMAGDGQYHNRDGLAAAATAHEPVPSIPLAPSSSFRNWTHEFQEILKKPLQERGTELHKLCEEFVNSAKKLGEVIIKERHLPVHKKTIKPLEGKGLAGGQKYRVENIFFKFAVDAHDIYPDDKCAMKVAGHELKGLTAYVSAGMHLGLNFPLLCLIDWRGYRLIATSVLDISEDTLVYGSCDGGKTVRADSREMNEMMEKIARILNVKGHLVGEPGRRTLLYGPVDIEGHRTRDGKYYVVDTARVWPPETPDRTVRGSFLFQLLRPEFVARYDGGPLSSDAFSAFGEDDADVHNNEVVLATNHLRNRVIPDFAAALDAAGTRDTDPRDLIDDLHRAGINCRYLGRVRARVTRPDMRALLLLETVARTLKSTLQAKMRRLQSSEDSDFRALAVDFFNLVFGTGEPSRAYWAVELKAALQAQYPLCLSESEAGVDVDLRPLINMRRLYVRLQQLTGARFARTAPPPPAQWQHSDLEELEVLTKHMYAVPRIEADALAELARTKSGEEAARLYALAWQKYRTVLSLKADDASVMRNIGTLVAELASLKISLCKRAEDVPKCELLFGCAHRMFRNCIAVDNHDYKALSAWGNALCAQAQVAGRFGRADVAHRLFAAAAEKFRAAAELRPEDPDVLYNWANQLSQAAKLASKLTGPANADNLYRQAIDLYKRCLRVHRRAVATAMPSKGEIDPLINLGCCYLAVARRLLTCEREDAVPVEVGMEWLRKAERKFDAAERLVRAYGLTECRPDRLNNYLDILAYNRACCAAVRGDAASCEQWLHRCSALPPSESLAADEDLKVLTSRV